MGSFRSKPVGWRYESQRHSLAARGVKTYMSRFRIRRVLPTGAVEHENPEGKKIIYAPRFQNVVRTDELLPTPDDVAYIYDEMPSELMPADTVLVSRRADAVTEAAAKIKDAPEDLMRTRDLLSHMRARGDEAGVKLFKKLLKRREEELKEGAFRRELKKELRRSRGISGHTSEREYAVGRVFVLPYKKGEKYENIRNTLLHEQGHKVENMPFHAGEGVVNKLGWQWGKEFSKETSPTDYGSQLSMEDFAESFALARSGTGREKRWEDSILGKAATERRLKREKEMLNDYKRYKGESQQNVVRHSLAEERVKRAEESIKEYEKKLSDLNAAENQYQARVKWFEQNVPNWFSLTAREREEMARSPKVLAAEALVKSGVKIKKGQEKKYFKRRG